MAETKQNGALPKGFRSAELGWPELHRVPRPPYRLPLIGDALGTNLRTPLQDSLRIGRRLGPIFRRKGLRTAAEVLSGSDFWRARVSAGVDWLLLRRYELRPDPAYRLHVAERLTLMPEGLTLHLDRRCPEPEPSTRPEMPENSSEASSASSCPVTGAGE